jgi:hypothetical protein
MSMFDRIFGNKEERKIKEQFEEIRRDVDKTYKPCKKIAEEIIRSSQNCLLKTKEYINCENEKERILTEMTIFHEYIYFFMHMTLRTAFDKMKPQQIEKLQEYIGPIITGTAIDSYVGHWPEDIKNKFTNNFIDGLNDAEMEYAAAKRLATKGSPFDPETIIFILGKRIADDANSSSNPVTISMAGFMAMDELIRVKFHELIDEAAKTL